MVKRRGEKPKEGKKPQEREEGAEREGVHIYTTYRR